MSEPDYDAIIIGGGFYGTMIAIHLATRNCFRVLLVERESILLTRASYNNQARVHNGYHYPRSFITAYRSRINMPRFIHDWPEAIEGNFTHLYAIARRNSKITSRQFAHFCKEIGAKIDLAGANWRSLFEARLIEEVFVVEESAFNSKILASLIEKELLRVGVEVCLETQVIRLTKDLTAPLQISVRSASGQEKILSCRHVFNCTYSRLNQFESNCRDLHFELKQEITEMALIKMPPALEGLGVTVMDGPFFSTMPFPARGLHTLSHVRYTPHESWNDKRGVDPYQKLSDYDCVTRADRMIRDAGRYLPSILDAKYVESLFEIKTLLVKNEKDDGRPILFEKHRTLTGCYFILGGKIDNIYDILERLDEEFIK